MRVSTLLAAAAMLPMGLAAPISGPEWAPGPVATHSMEHSPSPSDDPDLYSPVPRESLITSWGRRPFTTTTETGVETSESATLTVTTSKVDMTKPTPAPSMSSVQVVEPSSHWEEPVPGPTPTTTSYTTLRLENPHTFPILTAASSSGDHPRPTVGNTTPSAGEPPAHSTEGPIPFLTTSATTSSAESSLPPVFSPISSSSQSSPMRSVRRSTITQSVTSTIFLDEPSSTSLASESAVKSTVTSSSTHTSRVHRTRTRWTHVMNTATPLPIFVTLTTGVGANTTFATATAHPSFANATSTVRVPHTVSIRTSKAHHTPSTLHTRPSPTTIVRDNVTSLPPMVTAPPPLNRAPHMQTETETEIQTVTVSVISTETIQSTTRVLQFITQWHVSTVSFFSTATLSTLTVTDEMPVPVSKTRTATVTTTVHDHDDQRFTTMKLESTPTTVVDEALAN